MDSYAPANFADASASVQGNGNMLGFQSEGQSKALAGYTMIPDKFYSNKPCRNALGLVGGNDVSVVNAPMVDVESDLYGITRPNTKCNFRQYNPECALGGATECPSNPNSIKYYTKDTNELRTLSAQPTHLRTCQMNSYQPVAYPKGFTQATGNTYRF
uniref:Uncharacterized protein n=1 Tax=viral metagenome TaxID=1070528 RepID=A0A6C0BIJ6_9ZZZZ